jgi:CRISPR/Cas system CMR subunit Cmr4 (Cas7 group RAMP superfamily)
MKQTLTDQEIRTLAAIIQTCSQRGAFKAEEMVPVGTLFNRLIQIATPTQPQGDNDEEKEKETK